jgi:hypothetical protein
VRFRHWPANSVTEKNVGLKAAAFIPNFSAACTVRQAGTVFLSDHALLAAAGLHDRSHRLFHADH